MGVPQDAAAERAVIAGIAKHGVDAYLEVADYVKPDAFMIDSNRVIYRCIEHIYKHNDKASIDIPSIISAAHEIGMGSFFDKKDEVQHLSGVLQTPIELDNVRRFGGKLARMRIARLIQSQLSQAHEKISTITGTESILSIISMAEVDFSSLMDGEANKPVHLGADAEAYVRHLMDNPVEQIGIATGFPVWDRAIGGGLRPATINMFGARSKVGKSVIAGNMAYNIAKQGIPVLILDTEMTKEDHIHRMAARLSGVPINDIETGKCGSDELKARAVIEAAKTISGVPIDYHSIAGMKFEDQLSVMRRWLKTKVGFNPDGSAKPCVIVYDYLKLMDAQGLSADMKEYQLLGFMMTTLHNFGHRYRVPFLAFIQLNKDGINKEDSSATSQSDRINWLCSNFTIFKVKTKEEYAIDGVENGNRKMRITLVRHGPGLEDGDYINCHMNKYIASVVEGTLKSELQYKKQKGSNDGFVDENDNPEIPFD